MICKCGHEEDEHYIGTLSKVPVCALCRELSMPNEYHKFKLNNLRYLEEKYEEGLK
jgi:hypothetical protein